MIILSSLCALAQSGGTFSLSHSVVASGGGSDSTGGSFSVSGTVGQGHAGTRSTAANYDLRSGFWFQNLIPTAASVSVSGRVATFEGRGIANARLTLLSPDGTIRAANSNLFGYYRFDNVEVGQTYILEVNSKHFSFAEPVRVFNLVDELTDMNFVALIHVDAL